MKRDEVRQVDMTAINEFGMLGLVLMENAGRGAAEWIVAQETVGRRRACIVCGTGNNGGDGYVIARHLELAGFSVRIVSLVPIEKLTGDAAANAEIAVKAGISIEVASHAEDLQALIVDEEVIVDCMLGTGATGAPRGIYADAVRVANARNGMKVAIDLPTGLDCDTGQPGEPTFRADLTLTFVAVKDGFAAPSAGEFLGAVEVVGIGVPKALLDRYGVQASLDGG